jgi:hypothetical protein
MVDGLDKCETSVMIPLNPVEPWMGTIISIEPDTTIEHTALIALTSLYESRLVSTVVMPIALFLIRYQENPVWKQRLEVMSNLEAPYFNTVMAAMAIYV